MIYTLFLNSYANNSNIVPQNDYQSVTFNNMDWNKILPTGDKFKLYVSFKQESRSFAPNKSNQIQIRFGGDTNHKDQTGCSSNSITAIRPYSLSPLTLNTRSYYKCSAFNGLTILRPSIGNLVVDILNYDGSPSAAMIYGWVLILKFEPILE